MDKKILQHPVYMWKIVTCNSYFLWPSDEADEAVAQVLKTSPPLPCQLWGQGHVYDIPPIPHFPATAFFDDARSWLMWLTQTWRAVCLAFICLLSILAKPTYYTRAIGRPTITLFLGSVGGGGSPAHHFCKIHLMHADKHFHLFAFIVFVYCSYLFACFLFWEKQDLHKKSVLLYHMSN